MSDNNIIDHGGLGWVKEEIDSTLKQARQALEDYVENPDDETQLRFCITYIHQVFGTLHMVELYGASLFAEEMEELATALLNNEVKQKEDAYEVLMRAIIQLPDYLEKVQSGLRDDPLILLPLLNDIRALRSAKLLSENAMINVEVGAVEPIVLEDRDESLRNVTINELAKRHRHSFQLGLLGWYRGHDEDDGLKSIDFVLSQLEQACRVDEFVRLWWVARGVVESLRDGGLEASSALKLLLGNLDRELRTLIAEGELVTDEVSELCNNLLYYIAQSTSDGERVSDIQQKFNLGELRSRQQEINSARETMAAPGLDMMETVVRAIKEDLVSVKDALDLAVRSDDLMVDELKSQVDTLNKTADTLGMLGQGAERKVIQAQVAILQEVLSGDREFTESLLMEVASALLYVESSLEAISHKSIGAGDALYVSASDAVDHSLPESEMRQIQGTVLHEIVADIGRIKEAVVTFIDAPWDHEQLVGVPEIVERVRGGIQMMSLDYAASLMKAISQYLCAEVLDKKLEPSQDELDTFADALTGLEYYIEALLDARPDSAIILNMVRDRLALLGYEVLPPVPVAGHEYNEGEEGGEAVAGSVPDYDLGEVAGAEEIQVEELELLDTSDVLESEVSEACCDDKIVEMVATAEDDHPESLDENEIEIETVAEVQGDESPLFDLGEVADTPSEVEVADNLSSVSEEPGLEQLEEGLDVQLRDDSGQGNVDETVADVLPAAHEAQSTLLNEDIDEDILEIFVEEAEEELGVIGELFPQWRSNIDDEDALSRIRRAYHTLKGSGRMVGATLIGEYAWSLENMLNRVLDKTIEVGEQVIDLVGKSLEVTPVLVACLQGGKMPSEDVQLLIDQAFDLVGGGKAKPQPQQENPVIQEAQSVVDDSAGVEVDEQHEEEVEVMDATLYEIFTKEAQAHLADLHGFIDACSNDKAQCAVSSELVRALHTLHGSARMASASPIAEISGLLERYTKTLMGNGEMLPVSGMEVLEQGVNAIEELLEKLADQESALPDNSELAARIGELYQAEVEKEEQRLRQEHEAAITSHAEELEEETEFDQELVEVFLEEGMEILDNSEDLLKRWDQDAEDKEVVAELQRELHTLKGGARMAGITAIGDLSHEIESLMIAIVEGEVVGSPIDFMHRALDHLYNMLQQTQQHLPVDSADDLIAEVARIRSGELSVVTAPPSSEHEQSLTVSEAGPASDEVEEVEIASEPAPEELAAQAIEVDEEPLPEEIVLERVADGAEQAEAFEPAQLFEIPLPEQHIREIKAVPLHQVARKESSSEMVRVRADLLDNLVNYAGEVSIYRSRIEQQVNSFSYNLVELEQTIARLREQLRKLDMETEAQILFRYEREAESMDEDFDPLEMDRYSTMQQLSRALLETTSDISSIQGMLDSMVRESETLLLQQSRVNTDLQEGLMRTRMVSFEGLVPRMQRLVRQTCGELKKKARLKLVGEKGEMDRTLLERVTAPLEHMLRNSIAHGIESPQERKRLGKPADGQITLTIAREAGDVVIRLADDGAGMDLDAIRNKAIEQGLMDSDASLSDEDILQFVFESGFSTASKVTQVSGRGVGMDVVNSEIKQLGGSLYIDSVRNEGTTITLRLPFTLAVNQALLFAIGEENYAVPLISIEGIVRMTRNELDHFLSDPDARYYYAGNDYAVQSLSTMLGDDADQLPPGNKVFPVLLVKSGEHRAAIQVERLMGSREIVVKSVGPQISTVRGISGATILGNGDVVLILDIGAIIRMGVMIRSELAAGHVPRATARVEQRVRPLIMVVDDSITVRKVTTRLLERNNMDVITAKDGVDAVAVLQEHIPDAMLLDIEMPRMDGFELATHMRNEERLHNIPIIMITSRTGDKHRKRAESIGVNGYLGKPYQEHELLEHIHAELQNPEQVSAG